MNAPWNDAALAGAFGQDFDALVAFASRAKAPIGYGFLRADGSVDVGRPASLWINARMTATFALAQERGTEGAAHLVQHGLEALSGPFAGPGGGWYGALVPATESGPAPLPGARTDQGSLAALIVAACGAARAGHDRGRELLARALADQEAHWWDPGSGMPRHSWDPGYSRPGALRRLGDALSTADAYMSAWRVCGDRAWLDRARSIMRFTGEAAARSGWVLPDLFDAHWRPLPSGAALDVDEARAGSLVASDGGAVAVRTWDLVVPGDSLPGLGLRAVRLIARLARILDGLGEPPSPWMYDTAVAVYDRSQSDGWAQGGGFLLSVDGAGHPSVESRMWWVACEALRAAHGLGQWASSRGDGATAARLATDYARTVAWTDERLRAGQGRWIHELAPDGSVSTRVWEGRPDAYAAAAALLRLDV